MTDTWFKRLKAEIQSSGKDYKELSKAAKLGPNYVQQLMKNDKQPTVDKFLAIMNVIDRSKIMYVLTGRSATAEDQQFLDAVQHLSDEQKRATADYLRLLVASQEKQEQPGGSQD
jgi:transcriptional regulator with XRE-family HTH domain